MEQNENSESPADFPDQARPPAGGPVLLTAHMPNFGASLVPAEPDTSFTETRCLRHDGWTPEKKRLFLQRFAECGIFIEACHAAGMSARAAYNLRDRDPLFAAGLDAASFKARAPLADEAYSRAFNGVVERIYRDGIVVAEKHRYDNRLTMAVLTRLDSRIDRAEEKGAAHLALVERWDDYLAAIGEDRCEDGLALLAPARPGPPEPAADLRANARDRELHELHLEEGQDMDEDRHLVWGRGDGWWTDYPPPAGFDGEEYGAYGDAEYRRRLTAAEQAVVDAEVAEARASARAVAEAQRDQYLGFGGDRAAQDGGLDESSAAPGQAPPLDSMRQSCHSRRSRSDACGRPGPGRRSRRSRRRRRKRC